MPILLISACKNLPLYKKLIFKGHIACPETHRFGGERQTNSSLLGK